MTVFRRICCFLTGFGFALLLLPRLGICASVQDIRLGTQSGAAIRVVIDLSEKVNFKIFPLKDPDRVVIDLPSTVFSVKEKDLPKKITSTAYAWARQTPKPPELFWNSTAASLSNGLLSWRRKAVFSGGWLSIWN